VRLITRNGHDWSDRFPWIVKAALKDRQKHFVIDGEAVVLGVDGVSDFNALHSRQHDEETQLYAFVASRWTVTTLGACRYRCARPTLPAYSRGIFVASFEAGELGPDLFRKACD
jgi:hypothetical protein